ncbi:hypothetical protein sos41_07180 [Alphaproteobacteria bacterium SO-S41]|nr:hypothetical protein sos41_07180 [Alphaproteobacteria bacterium SO-S41]
MSFVQHRTLRSLLLASTAGLSVVGAIAARAETVIDNATVDVPGTHTSPWTLADSLSIGSVGTATLNIGANGTPGTVSNTFSVVGANAGSDGTVNITGDGSLWDNSGSVVVGNKGTGRVTVSNGGALISHILRIGADALGKGAITVTGAGSTLTNTGGVSLGYHGVGSLTVANGGLVTSTGIIIMGEFTDGDGTLLVSDAGSKFSVVVGFAVGASGKGKATIAAGGRVDALNVTVGNSPGATGALLIDGAGSLLTATQFLIVGAAGAGTMGIGNGAKATVGSSVVIGDVTSGNGALTLVAGGILDAHNADFIVGDAATGKMSVGTGSQVLAARGFIGNLTGSNGSVLVTGAGSSWSNTGNLIIGNAGTGQLDVANAGEVTALAVSIGKLSGQQGKLSLSFGGRLTTGALVLGESGKGQLFITSGGQLVTTELSRIGNLLGSSGSAVVDGAGSLWNGGANSLYIGAAGAGSSGTLLISNGGRVTVNQGLVGRDTGETGAVTVTGAGSRWEAATAIRVGGAGSGTLTVADGGTVALNPGGVLNIAQGAGATGIVNIGAADGDAAAAPGVLSLGDIVFGSGNGTLVFNHTSTNYVLSSELGDKGTILHLSGITHLAAASGGYEGPVHVQGGTLFVDGALGNAAIDVGLGAGFGGKGSINGSVQIADGGRLLGVAGQTLTMGALKLNAASLVNVSLGAPGGQSLFDVKGQLVLDGTLNVTDAGGFGTGVYRLFTYQSLVDHGLAVGTLPGGFGTPSIQTAIPGQVNLLLSNGSAGPFLFWDGEGAGHADNGVVDGGDGIWSAIAASWTDTAGTTNGAMAPQPGFAVFEGTAGTVTVDASAGAVSVTGLQFATDGYVVQGDAIGLASAQTLVRVGDGTTGGASFVAEMRSALLEAGGLVKDDLGTLIFEGENTYAGGTRINAGTLQIGKGGAAGSIVGNIQNDGMLAFVRSDEIAFGGALTGSGGLVQKGSGVLRLTGNSSSFAGTTGVQSGTLLVDGVLGSPVTVSSSASLGGQGTIGGAVGIADGGHLLGVQGKTLTMGALTLGGGSMLDVTFGVSGAPTLFEINGALVLDGTLNIADGGGFGIGVYRLFNYGSLVDNGLDIGNAPAELGVYSVQTSVAGQVNLVLAQASGPFVFWDGGTAGNANNGLIDGGVGLWSAVAPNWTDAGGAANAAMSPQPGFAVFEGEGGTVTVDASEGAISIAGMQFAADGYFISGDAIGLTEAQTLIRVGDGTAAGAQIVALIDAELSGAGGLVKDDLGTLILTGANSYGGGTWINAGTLQIGAGAASGSFIGNVQDNGTLAFARSDRTIFTSMISGSGGVDVESGEVVFAAANAYAGLTHIFAGARLELGAGGAFGGDLLADGTLTSRHAGTYLYAGSIAGGGRLEQKSAGELRLTGDSTGFTGVTSVEAGTLRVDGKLGGRVQVLTGAVLKGYGTVGETTIASGATIAPGGSIGTLTINGNYTQGAGSTYQVEIAAGSASDRIVVNGKATLNGGAVNLVNTAATPFQLGQHFTILTATGGVAGGFATLTGDIAPLSLFVAPKLSYDATHAYLDIAQAKALASAAMTANQIAAATGADSLPQASVLKSALLNLQAADGARAAFDAISGELHPTLRTAFAVDARLPRESVLRRLATQTDNGISGWGEIFGGTASYDADAETGEAQREIAGFMLGIDLPAGENWRLGVAGGYSHSTVDLAARLSSGDIQEGHIGAYAGATYGAFRVRLGVAWSEGNIETNRDVAFAGYADHLEAQYQATTFQGFGEIGYVISGESLQLEPFVGLTSLSLQSDAFKESGGAAALIADRADDTRTLATIGARFETCLSDSATLNGLVAWRHGFDDARATTGFAFVGGGTFQIVGAPTADDSLALNLGLTWNVTELGSLTLSYSGVFADEMHDHAGRAAFSLAF